ncbi:hypothetical protein GPECTOR_8g81 [Gonium pectorale]|uniref:Uncharacterized protein n=1 Tax=Gonium pectorale TaxID=33097 RepID=A0A150GUT7_GONPE|nr:hypothetical protein GPECTOR_8g81 [Gonium pectorale]|eukprot:KXZ53090.1 hypothetical protein GPECTOR_8g81 [Gonium pectorale]
MKQLELQHEELQQKAARIQGLFQFLNFSDAAAFDRCLGRSGKSPDCLSRAPDGGPTRQYTTITTAAQNRKMRQNEAHRSVQLNAQRREPASLSNAEIMNRLKEVFVAYTDPYLYAHTGRREMNIVGFLRLMRDCRLLDNKLSLVSADVIFTRVDAGVDVDPGSGGTVLGDLHVDFGEFMRCLHAVVRMKFPKITDEQEALLLLARKWVLPFASDSGTAGAGSSVDGLFSRSTMNLIRKYDGQLKRLFAWYSSLGETDPSRVSWAWAREHGGTISSSGFVLMLLNFEVLPVLLSKGKALDTFDRCEAANDGDEKANRMYYPAFLETISEIALEVGKFVLPRIRAAASPDELKLLRRYAESCPPPHGPKVLQAYQDALVSRGRDPSSLLEQGHALYDAEGVKRHNEEKAAAALRKKLQADAEDVVQRRENLRQRFALTRLRNFYRDVRTFNNNTTWPPERDTSPQNARAVDAGDAEVGVHVAFYDAERAIKTPTPVWIPVGHVASRRYTSTSVAPDQSTPTGAGAAAVGTAAAAAAPGTMLSGAAGNVLVLEVPPAAAASKPAAFLTPTGQNGQPGYKQLTIHIPGIVPASGGPGTYVRSPKPYMLKVSIEDRDEHEAIMDLAGRLPYIRTQPRGGGDAAAATGALAASASVSSLHGRPRAVTAPADLAPQRRVSQGLGTSTAEPSYATAGEEPGYSGLAVEDSRLTAASSRPHLPPVHHQLHRQQATAAALAALAGQAAPRAHLRHSHGGASSLHLPPAASQPFHPLPHPHGADPASSQHLHMPPLGPSASVASLNLALPLGPSPSQLGALGVIPQAAVGAAGMLSESQRSGAFAATGAAGLRSSLHRGKSQRRRPVDARGMPQLPLPVESKPSMEVEAALKELDRFDSSMVSVVAA